MDIFSSKRPVNDLCFGRYSSAQDISLVFLKGIPLSCDRANIWKNNKETRAEWHGIDWTSQDYAHGKEEKKENYMGIITFLAWRYNP